MSTEATSDSAAGGPVPAEDAARIDALIDEARTLARTGAAARALARALEAVARARRANDVARCVAGGEALADTHYALSAYPEALAQYRAALASWRRLDDRAGQVRCLHGIASVDIYIGDYALALGRLEEALRLLRATVAGHAWDSLRPGLTVTISIGVVDRAAYSSSAEMLAAADARLYEAKRAGRNCVR